MQLLAVMASADVKKVLQLKRQLLESAEGHTLLKTLKKLQELDITIDILAETGIGKVVNSFRKHGDAGEVAKTLVHRWKKLVPKDPLSITQTEHSSVKETCKPDVQETDQEEQSLTSQSRSISERKLKNGNSGPECKPSKNADGKNKVKPSPTKLKDAIDGEKKQDPNKDSDNGPISQTSKKSFQSKEKTSSYPEQKDEDWPKKLKKNILGITEKQSANLSTTEKDGSLIQREGEKKGNESKRDNKDKKRKEKATKREKNPENSDFETPSMSFEESLSYDLNAPKRKKRLWDGKNVKRFKPEQKEDVSLRPSSRMSSIPVTEAPIREVSKGCVLDLLNVPLFPISPECEDLTQYQYFTEKKAEEKAAEVSEEPPVFTGQRLNKKMQVYSGSKVAHLPTMMTLYQQCIRTLQNNIDSLYEIGGVPFEILEPVLERCTPEQLLRIEEHNPVYMGVTDHLWERHCHRDFRNAHLEEYESWREMYLRLFEERERKFQQLTKSIVSAHSGKPKGRQVKMAFIHSVAKPPRNIRIQQELHGTAGPGLPHTSDKPSGKSNDSRGRSCFSELPKPPSIASGSSQPQDPRKLRRVAPIMAKSLRAFKTQLGRRR